MFSDFHLHTEFSQDSQTPVRDQIDQAIGLGMKEICITDHHDYGVGLKGGDFILDFDRYIPTLLALRAEYEDRIAIRIGIELGLQVRIKEYLNQLTHRYPFDYIIGSSHFVDGQDPYYPEFFMGREEKEAYEDFFKVTLCRVKAIDCFDSLGHLDYVVRYGPNKNQFYTYDSYKEYIDPILNILVEKGKGLECNTGGFQYGLGHPNPTEEILTRFRELGGEILTIGSDAHVTQNLGYDFPRLKDLLLSCGFRYYCVFHDRKPEFVKIE